MTPFRVANVPPPMALQKIERRSNIVDAAIFGEGADTFIAVLEGSSLSIYGWDVRKGPTSAPCLLATIGLGPFLFQDFTRQVIMLNKFEVLVLASARSGSIIHAFRLDSSSLKHVRSTQSPAVTSIVTPATALSATPYLHFTASGEVSADAALFDSENHSMGNMKTALTVFPKQTSEIKLMDIRSQSCNDQFHMPAETNNETIAFGLTPSGSLFANKRRLANNCTSFLVTPAHLIYTTTLHFLKLVHMTTVEGRYFSP